MTKHRHHKAITAWANGDAIEWSFDGIDWKPLNNNEPRFDEMLNYRVKPAEPEKKYPLTQLTYVELRALAAQLDYSMALSAVANAALRHACDSGQIVTSEEFDRAAGDRKKRDMAVALAVRQAIENRISVSPAIVNGRMLSISFQNFDVLDIIKGVKP